MKNYSSGFAQHIAQRVTTLAICWRVEKRNGELILGTDHDRNIEIVSTNIGRDTDSPPFTLEGIYRAAAGITASDIRHNTDMSVDNMEVNGALDPDLFIDVSVADLEAGLLDGAGVTTFRVNWQNPNDYQDILRHGYLGEHFRTQEGAYRIEVRGLTQVLQQNIIRTAGETCDVERFGDARCKFDVAARTVTGTVTSVTSRRRFNATLSTLVPAASAGYFNLGELAMTSGANEGFTKQVMNDAVGSTLGNIELWERMPNDVQIGDTFTMTPGCNRLYPTCKDVHDNLLNFRGPAFFAPGMDQIIRAP